MRKVRKIKGILSILLTIAILSNILNLATITVSANPNTWTVNRTVNRNSEYTYSNNMNLRVGDTFTINITFPAGNEVDFLLITPPGINNRRLTRTNGTANYTFEIRNAGTHQFRIRNNSGNNLAFRGERSFLYVNHAVMFYDPLVSQPQMQLWVDYMSAIAAFRSTYGVLFDLDFDRVHRNTSNLNGRNCPRANNLMCNTTSIGNGGCGTRERCGLDHHKGASRLNNVLTSSTSHIIRVVGHQLCWWDNSNHIAVGGLANIRGRNSIVSSDNASRSGLRWLIQHELSHNLGARHARCLATSTNRIQCVLLGEDDMGLWCVVCALDISRTLTGLPQL